MPIPATTSARGNNKIIAMLVDQISDPFLAEFARRLDRKARSLGYKLVFGNTESDIRFTTKLISVFHNMNVAGYIIAPPAGMDLNLKKLFTKGRQVVLFDTDHADPSACRVSTDNYQGAYDAVKHLVANGRNRIGFLTPRSAQKRMVDRRHGYEKAINDLGLETFKAELPASPSPEVIEATIKELVCQKEQTERPDALIFADNNMAFTGIGVLRRLKLRIPRDLAVIAFDDNDYFSLFSPGITAVVQPLNDLVEKTLQSIIGHPSQTETGAKEANAKEPNTKEANVKDIGIKETGAKDHIVLPAKLVIRQSSAPARSMPAGAPAKLLEM